MNKCKTCKFWEKKEPSEYYDGYYKCSGICRSFAKPDSKDAYIDGCYECDGVYVYTGPEFGCVLWESKDEQMQDV